MKPLLEHQAFLTRRQFFGRSAMGLGTARQERGRPARRFVAWFLVRAGEPPALLSLQP